MHGQHQIQLALVEVPLTCIRMFLSPQFFFSVDSASVHKYPVNPACKSATNPLPRVEVFEYVINLESC